MAYYKNKPAKEANTFSPLFTDDHLFATSLYERPPTVGTFFVILLGIMSWLFQISNRVGAGNFAGVITGLIGMAISFGGRGVIPGRFLGDPVPLMLTAQSILRGNFLYLNWRHWLWPLLFFSSIALLAVFVLRYFKTDPAEIEDDARRAAQLAAGLNVGVVALMEVDAMMVAVWYLMTGFIAVSLASFVAGRLAHLILGQTDPE